MKDSCIIIVAGGSGSRMKSAVAKQFLPLCGRPVLVRTVEKFLKALPGARIVVVLPADGIAYWQELSKTYGIDGTHQVCAGGETRFHSVRKGLECAGNAEYIAVHDGVRPLVSTKLITDTLAEAQKHGTAIPALEPTDSFRIVEPDGITHPIDRSILRAVQTPQIFREDLIRMAYAMPYDEDFTDDATVVERSGIELHLCEGENQNIKITRPADLFFAESIVEDE